MVSRIPEMRPLWWRCGGFLVLARNTAHSNDITPDWIYKLWIDAVGDIRLRHIRPLRNVLRYHVDSSCSPQAGRSAGLGFSAMIQIRVRCMGIAPKIGKDPTEETVGSTELGRVCFWLCRFRRLVSEI